MGQLARDLCQAGALVDLRLDVPLPMLMLLLQPFLRAALREFVPGRIIVLDVVVHTTVLPSRLNRCFGTLIPKFVLPLVEARIIFL